MKVMEEGSCSSGPLEAGRTSRNAANNAPLGEGSALPLLSPRQQKLISFALWRFAADARAQADWAAQKSSNRPTADVGAFLWDAEDAEHLLGVLRASFAEQKQ